MSVEFDQYQPPKVPFQNEVRLDGEHYRYFDGFATAHVKEVQDKFVIGQHILAVMHSESIIAGFLQESVMPTTDKFVILDNNYQFYSDSNRALHVLNCEELVWYDGYNNRASIGVIDGSSLFAYVSRGGVVPELQDVIKATYGKRISLPTNQGREISINEVYAGILHEQARILFNDAYQNFQDCNRVMSAAGKMPA